MDRWTWLKWSPLLLLVIAIAGMPERLSGQGQSETRSEKAPFSLAISARTSSLKTGSAIWVDALLEDRSDHRILIYKAISEDMDQGGWVYQIVVHDEQGGTPQKTKYALGIGAGGGDGGYVPLYPGEKLTHSVNISKLYHLSRPGKYRIQFRRYDEETKTYVISNAAMVTVNL